MLENEPTNPDGDQLIAGFHYQDMYLSMCNVHDVLTATLLTIRKVAAMGSPAAADVYAGLLDVFGICEKLRYEVDALWRTMDKEARDVG